jgi:predicted lysophospholipase L1 biosynthesis ABC-type transport system permease subunit
MTPPATSIRNATSLERALGTVTDVIGRLIVISGLGALVIGGVGIINTMLVMVRRRTLEIATLKTFGLKGGQIATLFVWEACLLGIGGSALGVMLGYGLGGVVNRFGEALVQQSLVWRFYPESGIYGMVLGLSITLVFGVLPVLTGHRSTPCHRVAPQRNATIVSAGIVPIHRGVVAGGAVAGGDGRHDLQGASSRG